MNTDDPPEDPPPPQAAARGPYHSRLRARQKAQTTDLILDAVGTLLHRADLSTVTMAEVARVAEVTERTVYRHFPTREDLLEAFWRWEMAQTGGAEVEAPSSLEGFLASMRQLFENLDSQEMLVRAVLASPEGRRIRQPTSEQRLARLQEFLAAELPGLPVARRLQLAAAIAALSGLPSWLYMRDICGYDGRAAGEAASYGIRLMIATARATA
jgi:AcrR family transcriptional regulator